jgi:AraC-like DNA-binding protein
MTNAINLPRLYENLTQVFQLTGIPAQVRKNGPDGQTTIPFSIPDLEALKCIALPTDIERRLAEWLARDSGKKGKQDEYPLIHVDATRLLICCIPIPRRDSADAADERITVTLGPCFVPDANRVRTGNGETPTIRSDPEGALRDLSSDAIAIVGKLAPRRELQYVHAAIRVVWQLIGGDFLELADLLERNAERDEYRIVPEKTGATLYERREETKFHLPYSAERELWDLVRRGAIEEVTQKQAMISAWGFGIIGKTNLRHEKNMLIASTTLATRAAIDGGVPDEIAYAMSDGVIASGEDLSSVNAVILLKERMIVDFTELVIRYKKKTRYSPEVARCVDYVSKYLFGDVSLKLLSGVTSLSPSQISRKFKKETGISIVEYVQRERVEEAKRMLVFSSRALPEIANCLNFASQSYFTAVFRKIVGMTPAEYRRANG